MKIAHLIFFFLLLQFSLKLGGGEMGNAGRRASSRLFWLRCVVHVCLLIDAKDVISIADPGNIMDRRRLNLVLLSAPQQSVMHEKHALLSPFAHGEEWWRWGKWHSCFSLHLSDWGKTIFCKENSSQKAKKYLVEIPFFIRKWVLLIQPIGTYDEFDSTNPC